jgi:hypothetical protein
MLMELTGVRDILARAAEWRQIGVERLVYHREWDAQTAGRQWRDEDKAIIRQLIEMGYKVTITGGLTLELIPFFSDLDPAVLICGRSIREKPDPRASAREIRLAIEQIWSDSYNRVQTSSPRGVISTDTAAKAIRWGISELGLLLTIDGTNCLGCNSQERFCKSPRTEIYIPAGVDRQLFISQLITNMAGGESQAVGMSGNQAFYLDVGELTQISEQSVLNLLSATGTALQKVGQQANLSAAMTTARDILNE